MKRFTGLAAATAAALTLAGCGAATDTTATPETVTKTVIAPAETVTTVPQVCLDALDAADVLAGASSEALTLTASSLGEVPAAIDAVLAGDVAELERINAVLDENTDQMNTIDMEAIVTDYANARDACRGEA